MLQTTSSGRSRSARKEGDINAGLHPGARVILQNMNTEAFRNHVAEVVAGPSLLEPRVAVRVCGTKKEVKVRPESCRRAQQPRTEDDLKGGQDARFIAGVLTRASPKTFLPEVLDHIFRPLRLSNVEMKEVTVSSCSSEAQPHPLSAYTYKAQCTLEPGDKSCWISRAENNRPEWIVYCLGPSMRRVDYVYMSIPTMPHGPLSVRRFHLEYSNTPSKDWESRLQYHFVTLDEEGLQEFAVIPPIEAQYIRLVCTQNAAEDDASIAPSLTSQHDGHDPIGFWQIKFA